MSQPAKRRPPAKGRRPAKKHFWTPKRLLIVGALVLALLALSVYFVTRYRRDLLYAQYPLRYKEQIVRYAEEYDLEPWHLAAVIRCESSFNPQAQSGAGARGLMQIMPETGAWLAGKFDEKDSYTDDSLFDVETSLKYGCWYLRWLKQQFSGDLVTVTAAYHAGQGQVRAWVNSALYSDDGLTVARIPFDTTAVYVERVTSAYEHYREMYSWEEYETDN